MLSDSFPSLLGDNTDLNKRMVSVSNLLLMREQQSQYNNSEQDKDPSAVVTGDLRMTVDMQMQENKGNRNGTHRDRNSPSYNENGEEVKKSRGKIMMRNNTNDEVDDDEVDTVGSCGGSDRDDDDGEGPLRIVLGTTPNPQNDDNDSDGDQNEETDNKTRYDHREQQLLNYQQRKLQMHQDLTAYNTGSLTVTRFPMNGHQTQAQTAERCTSGGKFFVMPSATANNERSSPSSPCIGLGGCRTGSGLSGGDRETISSPQLNPSSNPFYFNNNNNNNIPNNNSNACTMMAKGLGIKSNGHTQMIQEQTEKLQRYHAAHSHSQGQKRHSIHGQQQQQHGKSHDRKSQNLFPNISDVKPDSIAAHSQLNTLSRSIGNALLNLASLGSLAALQQQQQHSPNSSSIAAAAAAVNSGSHYSSTNNNNNNNMTPLNLVTGAGSPNPNSGSMANTNNNADAYLAQYIKQQDQQHPQTKNSGNFISSQSFLQPGSLPNPNGSTGSANLPQLILASGNIVTGIQGAQLLIPTAQGLMTQTILTIPITQPVSPSSLLSPTPPGNIRPPSEGSHAVPPCQNSPPPGTTPLHNHLNLNPHLVNQSQQQQCVGGASISHNILNNSQNVEKLGNHERMNLPSNLNMSTGLNRITNGRRESGTNILASASQLSSHGHSISMTNICPPQKMSPCSSSHSHDQDSDFDFDKGSDNDDSDQMVDGINLDEIKEFAKAFKLRRLSLGLTQTQVGQALSITEGPAYSQSAICSALAWQMAQSNSNRTSIPQSSVFEKLDITPKSAQKIKPVLERWMKEAEDRFKNGHNTLHEFVGMEPSKKRKRRTSFTPQALEILNTHFERNTHPSGAEITTLAHQLGYEREVIRIWFCNKRQALKNTVRMMSKGSPCN